MKTEIETPMTACAEMDYPPCPEGICDGSGYVAKSYYDVDSHNYIPDGEELCLCRKPEREYEKDI